MLLLPEKASALIRAERVQGPIEVSGRLDLSKFDRPQLPAGLHCYDLDASGSQLVSLPPEIRIDSRLILDNCLALSSLPEGLQAGSISLRNCPSLVSLPENLSTWF